MARPVAGDYLRDATPIFSPVARPVDTYVASRPQESGSAALLRALGGLDKQINPVLTKIETKAKEDELAEGQRLFQENRSDFRDAVKSGAIPLGASPYVRKGYRRSQLHTLGANYATDLATALETSDIHKIEDPAEIEKYLAGFYKEFAETNGLGDMDNVELAENFSPLVQRAHDSFRLRQSEKNVAWMEEERLVAFEGEVLSTIDMLDFDGPRTKVGAAVASTAEFLTAKAEELDQEGVDRKEISRRIIGIVAAAAEEKKDLDILAVLGQVKLGTAPLSSTMAGRNAITQVRERVSAAQQRAAAAADAAYRRAQRAKTEEASLAASRAALEGDDEAYRANLETLSTLDASEFRAVISFKSSQDAGRDETLQRNSWGEVAFDLFRTADEASAIQLVNEAIIAGRLPYQDGNEMLNSWRRENNDEDYGRFVGFQGVSQWAGQIESMVAGEMGMADPEARGRAGQARSFFTEQMEDWYVANKAEDGTFNKIEAARTAREVFKQTLEIYMDEAPTEDRGRPQAPTPVADADPTAPDWAQPAGAAPTVDWSQIPDAE